MRVFESAAPAVTWKKKGVAVKSKTVNDCDGAIREALPSRLVVIKNGKPALRDRRGQRED